MRHIFILLLFLGLFESKAQIAYRTQNKQAIFMQAFATSPIFSLNYEHSIKCWQHSFLAIQVGIGYVAGNTPDTNIPFKGISFPLSTTYNLKIFNQKANQCNYGVYRINPEIFLEIGAGYTFIGYKNTVDIRNYFFGITGLRFQTILGRKSNGDIIYFRTLFTPSYSEEKIEFRSGFGIGLSL
jgi:hypothetical protein